MKFLNGKVFVYSITLSLIKPIFIFLFGNINDTGKAFAEAIFLIPVFYVFAYYFMVSKPNKLLKELEENSKITLSHIGKNGFTELMAYAVIMDLEKIKEIVEAGSSINQIDDKGYTALMYAASNGKTESVRLLLSLGADKSIATKKGNTAIYFADLNEHWDTKKLLK